MRSKLFLAPGSTLVAAVAGLVYSYQWGASLSPAAGLEGIEPSFLGLGCLLVAIVATMATILAWGWGEQVRVGLGGLGVAQGALAFALLGLAAAGSPRAAPFLVVAIVAVAGSLVLVTRSRSRGVWIAGGLVMGVVGVGVTRIPALTDDIRPLLVGVAAIGAGLFLLVTKGLRRS